MLLELMKDLIVDGLASQIRNVSQKDAVMMTPLLMHLGVSSLLEMHVLLFMMEPSKPEHQQPCLLENTNVVTCHLMMQQNQFLCLQPRDFDHF